MFSGVKFIPRDEIDKDEKSDAIKKKSKKSSRKEKHRLKKKSSQYDSSDEDLERIKRGSKKKWYSSEEHSSESEDDNSSKDGEKRHRTRKNSKYEAADMPKKRSGSGKEKDGGKKSKERRSQGDISDSDLSDGGMETSSLKDMEIVRKEIGLEWMLRPAKTDSKPTMPVEDEPEKAPTNEVNPRELNPYLKDNGSGYPEDNVEAKLGGDKLMSSSIVGDGGASWRLKALKRAKEQAAREGRRLDQVVEERWGCLGQLTASVRSEKAAPSHAHLHAIKNRKRDTTEGHQAGSEAQSEKDVEKRTNREYLKDISIQRPKMREPRVQDSLSWGKKKGLNTRFAKDDASLVYEAVSSLNKFENDGSFMRQVLQKETSVGGPVGDVKPNLVSSERGRSSEPSAAVKDASSANQLAAKAFQLRLKGKHEEADKLLQEVENMRAEQGGGDHIIKQKMEESSSRYVMQDKSVRQKRNEDDGDMHLAQKIMENTRYNTYSQADDEYDYDGGPARKSRKKRGGDENRVAEKNTFGNRLLTQQERCLFCFENPKRPAHLVVAIANFSYLMLPQWEPVVPGHCCILPMQHVPSTRTVDDDVWEEIRNFKKCLIMMFAEQEKDVVFLETVMDLAKQRRHCLVECIPLPRDVAKEAPLYFKKAIDEAEDEWSQHNAKKLIDTSVKGLRASIPANFPYFHVEFGLYKGFVHVIDDEKQFKSSLGLNVIRGMLQLPEEDMHRRRRYEAVEAQKQAVKSFARDWAPFDWTKQLHEG
ncbi:uncharacterized protein LOC107422825 isoform X2 [Ziziphus jujuba]|uniref:Uncharacterized protein LOC107422825 isoform X2 n=1 Tax=Ziziphus jujuba TaxID=326968 RepID=A0ABM3IQV0_ZIZJJ|nr:uncharacterized protein LOC107422825 isoform X2 [Ziziphus jujuba]